MDNVIFGTELIYLTANFHNVRDILERYRKLAYIGHADFAKVLHDGIMSTDISLIIDDLKTKVVKLRMKEVSSKPTENDSVEKTQTQNSEYRDDDFAWRYVKFAYPNGTSGEIWDEIVRYVKLIKKIDITTRQTTTINNCEFVEPEELRMFLKNIIITACKLRKFAVNSKYLLCRSRHAENDIGIDLLEKLRCAHYALIAAVDKLDRAAPKLGDNDSVYEFCMAILRLNLDELRKELKTIVKNHHKEKTLANRAEIKKKLGRYLDI